MKKVLFVFWHGLGDNIMATPAIKKYKQTTGNYIGWAMLRRFKTARLMESNPHIDQIHWTSDAWLDHGGYSIGIEAVSEEGRKIGEEHGYDEVIPIVFNGRMHRILRGARDIGVELGPAELHPEFFYNEDDLKTYYDKIDIPDEYVFFHGKSGAPKRNMDYEWVKRWLKSQDIDLPVVSPDFTWDNQETPIAFAADVMKKASMRILTNSSMYHMAHALDLPVDLGYFRRRREYKQCRPLWANPPAENIIMRLGEIT